jgi:hypothetical protein
MAHIDFALCAGEFLQTQKIAASQDVHSHDKKALRAFYLVVDNIIRTTDMHALRMQGNASSPQGKDAWESLDVPTGSHLPGILYLAIELVDSKQQQLLNTGANSAAAAAAAATADGQAAAVPAAADGVAVQQESVVQEQQQQQQVDVLSRAPVRLKLRWNDVAVVEIVEGQGAGNSPWASSIIPHVNTPGVLHNM